MQIPALNGFFINNGDAYKITTKDTYRHWFNALWNDTYFAWVSHIAQGESLVQDEKGYRVPVICSRQIFIQDLEDKTFFPAGGGAECEKPSYECIHYGDKTTINTRRKEIHSSWTIEVPQEIPAERWILKIKNNSWRVRKLRLLWMADTKWGGEFRHHAYYEHVRGSFDKRLNLAILSGLTAYKNGPIANVYMVLSEKVHSFDLTYSGAIGLGSLDNPKALNLAKLSNFPCEMEKPFFALETIFKIPPQKEVAIFALIGVELEILTIKQNIKNYLKKDKSNKEIFSPQNSINVETPDKRLNALTTFWLPRQFRLGARWARVRHNGFRDIVQDIAALACVDTARSLENFIRILKFQRSDGYAPRTFIEGEVIENNFMDNGVWIAPTAYRIIAESGNFELLNVEVQFSDGKPGTIFEHIKLSLEYLWKQQGFYGLIKIGGGDWNDCINTCGLQGRGSSVWLSMAWCWSARCWLEILKALNHSDASELENRINEMCERINQRAWLESAGYYLRAFHDDGTAIGSPECEEGRISLLPQAWAVISGVADDKKALLALENADKFLNTKLGTIKLYPPYTSVSRKIGSIANKTPGSYENGGVYLHAMAFKLVADCMMKRKKAVAYGIKHICPFSNPIASKFAEPYVLSNSYFAKFAGYRYGTPGQSWGTGAAGWFYRALVDYVFGLRVNLSGITLIPCIPESWDCLKIFRQFRKTSYQIAYHKWIDERKLISSGYEKLNNPLLPLEEEKYHLIFNQASGSIFLKKN